MLVCSLLLFLPLFSSAYFYRSNKCACSHLDSDCHSNVYDIRYQCFSKLSHPVNIPYGHTYKTISTQECSFDCLNAVSRTLHGGEDGRRMVTGVAFNSPDRCVKRSTRVSRCSRIAFNLAAPKSVEPVSCYTSNGRREVRPNSDCMTFKVLLSSCKEFALNQTNIPESMTPFDNFCINRYSVCMRMKYFLYDSCRLVEQCDCISRQDVATMLDALHLLHANCLLHPDMTMSNARKDYYRQNVDADLSTLLKPFDNSFTDVCDAIDENRIQFVDPFWSLPMAKEIPVFQDKYLPPASLPKQSLSQLRRNSDLFHRKLNRLVKIADQMDPLEWLDQLGHISSSHSRPTLVVASLSTTTQTTVQEDSTAMSSLRNGATGTKQRLNVADLISSIFNLMYQ